jgi:cytochrome P450
VSEWPLWLIVIGADLNRAILTDDQFIAFFLNLPAARGSNLYHLAHGLLQTNGDEHRAARQLLLPSFQRAAVTHSFSPMVAVVERALSSWQGDATIDIAQALRELTLNLIGTIGFGADLTTHPTLFQQIRTWLHLFGHPLTYLLPLPIPGSSYAKLLRASDALAGTLRHMIAQRREHPADSRTAFDCLLQARHPDGQLWDDMTILGHANFLFLAGHETSANALIWTLILLTLHPDIYRDLLDEIQGLHGASPTPTNLERLPLLDRVVRESLRILSPTAYGLRHAHQPFELAGQSYVGDTTLIYSPFMTHRVSPIFERPAQFRPERWETINPSPYEYIPFGAGPRRCLGELFALQEIKIILILLLQRFRPELASSARIDYQVRMTLGPSGPVPIHLRPHSASLRPGRLVGSLRSLIDVP